MLVSFVVLAFLPFVNKESDGDNKQFERTGNWVGMALAAVSLLSLASLLFIAAIILSEVRDNAPILANKYYLPVAAVFPAFLLIISPAYRIPFPL